MSKVSDPYYLVDASIYIFQAHFSPFVECYDKDGNELSALFGFAQFLLQFARRNKPSYLALAHDESLFCGFRHQLCENYKSNRELPDENLEMQLKACSELGTLLGMSTFASKIYEADDIIGTLATNIRSEDPNAEITIVTRDKDLAQLLVSEQDCLWDYNGNKRRYCRDIVKEFGVRPDQFPDYLGLIGDSVDCISGVPGVGPVKAQALLKLYQGIDEIYENLDKIPTMDIRGAKGLSKTLVENKSLADLSKELATIVCEVSDRKEKFSSAGLENLMLGEKNTDAFLDFLDQYQFCDSEKRRLQSLFNGLG